MSDALSYSSELAAERSSERYCLEKRLQKHGLSYYSLENRLEKLGLKRSPSKYLLCYLESLKNDVYSMLDALIESGYRYYDNDEYFIVNDNSLSSALNLLDVEKDTPSKYLNVFRKLKEKMGFKTVNVSEQLLQVDKIFKISRFKGDVCRAIDILAEAGFSLRIFRGKKILLYEQLDIIRDLAQMDADRFLKTFYRLKEKLGYKTINVQFPKSVNKNSLDQIEKIIELSKIGNVYEAIDILANEKTVDRFPPWGFNKYKINKKKGITDRNVKAIRHISDKLWEHCLKGLTTCAYKSSPSFFIEFFKNLSVEEKKKALKGMFNCATYEPEVIRWLDKNYPELVREVGLSLI